MAKVPKFLLAVLLLLFTLCTSDDAPSPLPDLLDVLKASNLKSYHEAFLHAGIEESSMLRRMSTLDFVVNIGMKREEVDVLQSVVAKMVPERKKKEKKKKRVDVLLAKRQAQTYGRLVIDGAATSFEFMKATFGGHLPTKPLEFAVFDQPGCSSDPGPMEGGKGVIAVLERGTCNFLEKARNAQAAGFSVLAVVNTEEQLFQMPSGLGENGEMVDSGVTIPVVLLKKSALNILKHIQTTDPLIKSLFIPQDCDDDDSAACVTFYPSDVKTKDMFDASSGNIYFEGMEGGGFAPEFVTSSFGGTLPHGGEVIRVEPQDACEALSDDIDDIKDKIVLIDRGGCSFAAKVLNAQALGARAIIMQDDKIESPLEIIGASAAELSSLFIPVLMITKASGDLLEGYLKRLSDDEEGIGGAYISLTKEARIGIFWEEIRNWVRHCVTPKDDEASQSCDKLILALRDKSEGSADRSELVSKLMRRGKKKSGTGTGTSTEVEEEKEEEEEEEEEEIEEEGEL